MTGYILLGFLNNNYLERELYTINYFTSGTPVSRTVQYHVELIHAESVYTVPLPVHGLQKALQEQKLYRKRYKGNARGLL